MTEKGIGMSYACLRAQTVAQRVIAEDGESTFGEDMDMVHDLDPHRAFPFDRPSGRRLRSKPDG